MKIAAASAIAAAVSSDDLSPELIIPTAFDRSVVPAVSAAVATAADADGVTLRLETLQNLKFVVVGGCLFSGSMSET